MSGHTSAPLEVGVFELTTPFVHIKRHAAVMRADTKALIALTGPMGDPTSEADARLFAAAPDLLAAAEEVLIELKKMRADHWPVADHLRSAIAAARGLEDQ